MTTAISVDAFVALAVSLGGHDVEALSICASTDPTITATTVTATGYTRTHRDGTTRTLPHGFIPASRATTHAPSRSAPAHCPCCGLSRVCYCATGGRSGAVELLLCTCRPDPATLVCTCGRTSHRQPHDPDCLHATLTTRSNVHRGDCPLLLADLPVVPPPHAWRFRVQRECTSPPETPPAEKIWRDRAVYDLLPEFEGPPLDEFDAARLGTVVVIDTETTGIRSTDVVIELAAARIDVATGRILDQRTTLVHAGGVPVDPGARAAHKITDGMLATAPAFGAVWPRVVAFVGADRVVAHNATFDRRLLEQSIHAHNTRCERDADKISLPPWPWVDALAWARTAVPEAPRHSLGVLREVLGLRGGTAHRALGDVLTLAALVPALAVRSREVPEGEVWGRPRKAQVVKGSKVAAMRAATRTTDQSGVHHLPTLRGLDGAL